MLLGDTRRENLETVIMDSIKHFKHARQLYEDHGNMCHMFIMDMYIHLQCQRLDHLSGTEKSPNPKRVAYCEALVKLLEGILPPGHRHLAWMKERMSCIRSEYAQGDGRKEQLIQALQELEEGMEVTRRIYGQTHRKVSNGLHLKAGILEKLGEVHDAVKCLVQAKAILEEKRNPDSMDPRLGLIEQKLRNLQQIITDPSKCYGKYLHRYFSTSPINSLPPAGP